MSITASGPATDSPQTLFIDGEWRGGAGTYERFEPSNLRRSTGRYAAASPDDVRAAYDAAAAAQVAWASRPAAERADVLRRTADHLERNVEQAAQQLTADIGKVIRDARGEVLRAVATLRYFAGELLQPAGETYPSADATSMLLTVERALGVVCLITPWNFPCAIPVFKLAPALGFGNAVVWKPAEAASGSAMLVTESFIAGGLPDGVLNVVTGHGAEISVPLTRDPRLAAVSFTGSNAVGTRLREAVADRNVKVQLELGGKNPSIVLADADLGDAAQQVTRAAMFATGQRCTATSRVYVDRDVADEFIRLLQTEVDRLVVGDPFDEHTDVGPLAFSQQRDTVYSYLELAAHEGAEVLAGSRSGETGRADRDSDCFVAPTVLTNVARDSRILRDEIFGPVLVVDVVDGFEEALEQANDTEYGLSSAIFTKDIGRAMEFIRRTESGVVCINRETTGIEPHVPFGGVKGSSSMSRELGKAARQFFTTTKTVYVRATG